jgi:hypothetical protein
MTKKSSSDVPIGICVWWAIVAAFVGFFLGAIIGIENARIPRTDVKNAIRLCEGNLGIWYLYLGEFQCLNGAHFDYPEGETYD